MSVLEKVQIPEGELGKWKVEHFVADRTDWRSLLSGRAVPVGEKFTALKHGQVLVMSDTPAEMRDHYAPYFRAKGSCLINGLGIGMVLHNILKKPEVLDVTVIEKSEEVIGLVGPHYKDPRLTIIHADAFSFRPPKGKRYQMVWHDIWNYICADNLEEMAKLHRKYGRRADWQGSWCREQCRRGR